MCFKSDILKTKAVLSCHSFVHGNWRDKPVGFPRLKMNVMIIKVTFWKADPFPIHLGRKSLEVSCAVQLSKHDSEKRLRDKALTQPWHIALVPCWLRYFSSCRHYQEQKDNPDIQWKVSIEPTFVLHLITGMYVCRNSRKFVPLQNFTYFLFPSTLASWQLRSDVWRSCWRINRGWNLPQIVHTATGLGK